MKTGGEEGCCTKCESMDVTKKFPVLSSGSWLLSLTKTHVNSRPISHPISIQDGKENFARRWKTWQRTGIYNNRVIAEPVLERTASVLLHCSTHICCIWRSVVSIYCVQWVLPFVYRFLKEVLVSWRMSVVMPTYWSYFLSLAPLPTETTKTIAMAEALGLQVAMDGKGCSMPWPCQLDW